MDSIVIQRSRERQSRYSDLRSTAECMGNASLSGGPTLYRHQYIAERRTRPLCPLRDRADCGRDRGFCDFAIPLAAREYVLNRTGQSGEDWFILKPIVAGSGDRVDCTGASVTINGRIVANMPPELDTAGRRLPAWRENRILRSNEFFVLSTRIPNSFHSRQQIASVRKPWMRW